MHFILTLQLNIAFPNAIYLMNNYSRVQLFCFYQILPDHSAQTPKTSFPNKTHVVRTPINSRFTFHTAQGTTPPIESFWFLKPLNTLVFIPLSGTVADKNFHKFNVKSFVLKPYLELFKYYKVDINWFFKILVRKHPTCVLILENSPSLI